MSLFLFCRRLLGLICGTAAVVFPLSAEPTNPVPVLIIDGVNNHDWEPTTAWLKETMEKSGRFKVTVSTTPLPRADPQEWAAWRPDLSHYRVVVGNFNGGHRPNGLRWPPEVEKAFEAFVREGGGYVSFHAANNAFLAWRAYNEMIGLGWRDKTYGPSVVIDEQEKCVVIPAGEGRAPGHGPRHDFEIVVRDHEHPITRGFPKRWLHRSEQLTHGQHGLEEVVRGGELRFLTYAWSKDVQERQPLDWVRSYGKGRVYTTMLGHTWKGEENRNLRGAGFTLLLLRGIEWAATGDATLPLPSDFSSEHP